MESVIDAPMVTCIWYKIRMLQMALNGGY